MQEFAAAGVTTLSVACFGASLAERVAQVRACADALDRAGVGA
jgi:hypothetical protein